MLKIHIFRNLQQKDSPLIITSQREFKQHSEKEQIKGFSVHKSISGVLKCIVGLHVGKIEVYVICIAEQSWSRCGTLSLDVLNVLFNVLRDCLRDQSACPERAALLRGVTSSLWRDPLMWQSVGPRKVFLPRNLRLLKKIIS